MESFSRERVDDKVDDKFAVILLFSIYRLVRRVLFVWRLKHYAIIYVKLLRSFDALSCEYTYGKLVQNMKKSQKKNRINESHKKEK